MEINVEVFDLISNKYSKLLDINDDSLHDVEYVSISADDNSNISFNDLIKFINIKDIIISNMILTDNEFNILLSFSNLSKITFENITFNMLNENVLIKENFYTLKFIDCINLENYNISDNYYVMLKGNNCPKSITNLGTLDIINLNNIYKLNISNVNRILANINLNEYDREYISKLSNLNEFYKSNTDVMSIYRLFNDIYCNIDTNKNISQELFDYLVNIAINYDDPIEPLFRLMLYYKNTELKYNLIEDYILDLKDYDSIKKNKIYLVEISNCNKISNEFKNIILNYIKE